MRTNIKDKMIPYFAILGCFIAAGVWMFNAGKDITWEVLFPGLPAEVSVSKASHNAILYILKQTHEPVFRKDDGQNYYSKILNKWVRNLDDKEYLLCPDTKLKFNSEVGFGVKLFAEHMDAVLGRYKSKVEISNTQDCVVIKFGSPQPGFLEYLTLYENAPTVTNSSGIEDGLGPFSIESLGREAAVLRRKRRIRKGAGKIVLYDYKGGKDAVFRKGGIFDYNRIPPFDIPAGIKDSYLAFDNIQLKSINLVINHPDIKVRDLIYNCVNIGEFRKAYFPNSGNVYEIGNVFPMGVPGAKSGLPRQACAPQGRKMPPVVLANWRNDNSESLAAFARDFYSKTGLQMRIRSYQPSELARIIHSKPRPYNLLVMTIDAVRPEYNAFLSPFFREKAYVDYRPAKGVALYGELQSEYDHSKQLDISKAILDVIINERMALPLYQVAGKLYYPRGIKNLEAGRGYLEYPEVGDFRW